MARCPYDAKHANVALFAGEASNELFLHKHS